jgi:hypothetical protein
MVITNLEPSVPVKPPRELDTRELRRLLVADPALNKNSHMRRSYACIEEETEARQHASINCTPKRCPSWKTQVQETSQHSLTSYINPIHCLTA